VSLIDPGYWPTPKLGGRLSYHYGNDPDPGAMWCDTCNGRVILVEDRPMCTDCGGYPLAQFTPGPQPGRNVERRGRVEVEGPSEALTVGPDIRVVLEGEATDA
jgi:hypothetical protein